MNRIKKRLLFFKPRNLYRHVSLYRSYIHWLKRMCIPLMGGLPVYDVLKFFIRTLKNESVGLRASSIAFNLFLSLFPSLITLFTLLPYIPIPDLHKEILHFLEVLMPSSAFTTIEEALVEVMATRSGGLLSFGVIAALFFASNGVYSLMETFNPRDRRSYWKVRGTAMVLTISIGFLLIAGLSLFLLTEFSLEFIIYNSPFNPNVLYYLLIILQWFVVLILIIGAITILYRHGDKRSERWRYIFPGAMIASLLVVLTSIAYSYYVSSWANYSKLYGSLGAMIVTMLWLYFNASVIIIGHDFNRSLMLTRLSLMDKKEIES